jgi:hypothetical protein
MAGHENVSPKLTRMPSLAEWHAYGDESVVEVLAEAREKTEAVASDAAAARSSATERAENGATVEARTELVSPSVVPTVSRMPSLGSWAMSSYISEDSPAEDEDPTTSGAGDVEGNASRDGNASHREARVVDDQETRVEEVAKEACAPSPPVAETIVERPGDPPKTGTAGVDASGEKRKLSVTENMAKRVKLKSNAVNANPQSLRRSARMRGTQTAYAE